MFKVFNEFCGSRKQQEITISPDNLNNVFANIGPKLVEAQIDQFFTIFEHIKRTTSTFFLFKTNTNEIFKIINTMQSKKSSGQDGLNSHLIKTVAPVI